MVIRDALFTPTNGTERQVLFRASIAQVHVPYETGTPRFLDSTHSTLGLGHPANAVVLDPAECPGGALFDGNRICQQVSDRGYAWKFGTSFQRGEQVSIFMSSQLGQYNYVVSWNFQDDGVIEPRVGLTGRLQIIRSGDAYLPYGQRINPETDPVAMVGISHQHNVYYRLDFDIGGAGDNAVEKITLEPSDLPSPDTPCSVTGQCYTDQKTQLLNESVDFIDPVRYTGWRVYNKNVLNDKGRTIGYEIVPELSGLWSGMTSTTEPWSAGELWATRFVPCQSLATDNHVPHIPSDCAKFPGLPDNVTEMVAGAGDIDGQDVVVWYAGRFRHFPRDEDRLNMPIETVSFRIVPRSFHHQNPLEP